MEEVSKIDIALEYLEVALGCYLESGQYFAALHCAGAAEELLGKFVEMKGGESAFRSTQASAIQFGAYLYGQHAKPKDMADIINHAKNRSKHMDGSHDSSIRFDPRQEAHDLIERCMRNVYVLMRTENIAETERMRVFNGIRVGA